MRQHGRMSPELALRFDRETAPYRGQLYSRALRMTRSPEDAEDLVQDTLTRACGAFDRFSGEHPRAWLHRIMTNTFINGYRRTQRGPRILLVGGPEELPAIDQAGAAPADARPADAIVLDRIPAPEVAAAVAGLPDVFRRALLLTDVEGLSCRETAQVMGTPLGTVMSRLHRARAAVRAELSEQHQRPGQRDQRELAGAGR